jgi:NAD(P)-dependent dehydrogenase (short-subunit alcohol dehydrogenase family)/putative sterol carrier protein
VGSQDDHEFADLPAFVNSFTGDLLSVSIDPPAVYGMIQFEGGGRFMADFTDCELGDVQVGQRVNLSFRRRYSDKERGFTGYFWKAVPIAGTAPAIEEKGDIRFDDQVAIVTGAGAGLGKVYALELAKRGAKVVVNDLGGARDGSGEGSSSPADEVVEEIKALGGEAVASYDSVATAEGGEAIVNKAMESYGRLDILVNNAGILRDRSFGKMSPEDWEQVLSVHLFGAYNVTRPAFLKMREGGYGRVVMTTSAAGLFGNFGQTNYSAAKMGLLGLMNTLKLEGEKYDIKVNTVSPIAATRLTEDVLPPDLFEKLKPEFVAPLVLYLSSKGCGETGMIFNAGMGYFNRAAVVSGPGTVIGDGKAAPSVEEIHRNWDAIHELSGAKEYYNATVAFGPMIDAFSPKAEAPAAAEGLTVKTIFDRLPEAFQADKATGVDVVFQFKISGPDGGDWYATVKDGDCEVGVGVHESPTTTIIMSDEDFVGLIEGTVNAMQAYTTGKLKIEGDLMKSQLIEKLFKF